MSFWMQLPLHVVAMTLQYMGDGDLLNLYLAGERRPFLRSDVVHPSEWLDRLHRHRRFSFLRPLVVNPGLAYLRVANGLCFYCWFVTSYACRFTGLACCWECKQLHAAHDTIDTRGAWHDWGVSSVRLKALPVHRDHNRKNVYLLDDVIRVSLSFGGVARATERARHREETRRCRMSNLLYVQRRLRQRNIDDSTTSLDMIPCKVSADRRELNDIVNGVCRTARLRWWLASMGIDDWDRVMATSSLARSFVEGTAKIRSSQLAAQRIVFDFALLGCRGSWSAR